MGRKFSFKKPLASGTIDASDAKSTLSFDLGPEFGGDREVMWEHGYVGLSLIGATHGSNFGIRVLFKPDPGITFSLGGVSPIVTGTTTYALNKIQGFGTALPMPQQVEIDCADLGVSVGLTATVYGTFFSAS